MKIVIRIIAVIGVVTVLIVIIVAVIGIIGSNRVRIVATIIEVGLLGGTYWSYL